jgi:hypothetical protein
MTGIGPVMKEIREAYRVTQTRHTGAGRYLLQATVVFVGDYRLRGNDGDWPGNEGDS